MEENGDGHLPIRYLHDSPSASTLQRSIGSNQTVQQPGDFQPDKTSSNAAIRIPTHAPGVFSALCRSSSLVMSRCDMVNAFIGCLPIRFCQETMYHINIYVYLLLSFPIIGRRILKLKD